MRPSPFLILLSSFAFCAAAAPAPQASPALDASAFARHLEAELAGASEALRAHGEPLQALLGNSRPEELGRATEARVGQLRAAFPELVKANPHLFEELFRELKELEQLAHDAASAQALRQRGPGLADRLRQHLRAGAVRAGERLGAQPALVVSGGASLGSYQSGFLYYYSLFLQDRAELLRRIPPERRAALRALGVELPEDPASGFSLVTGASAGSVNALLAAYSGCLAPERVPARSIFFQTWNTLSLEVLLDPTSVTYDHMFSAKPIEDAIGRIKGIDPAAWKKCRFSLGVTTTRMAHREIDLAAAGGVRSRATGPIRLARYTEKFLLAATGEAGHAPDFCPFPSCDAQAGPEAPFLPRLVHADGAHIPMESVFNMVAASGAYPTAFSPRTVPHRYFDSETGKWIEDEKTQFSDGGIYNNNPLGLAVRMSRAETGTGTTHHRFIYFDPSATAWQWPAEAAQGWAGPGLLASFEDILKGFVDAARSAQLMDTIEAVPEVRERLDVPLRHGLLTGEHLMAMSAFLDEDFRTFDFHRGMVDAWHFLTQDSDNRLLFDVLARAQGGAPAGLAATDSPLFTCFVAFERSEAEEPGTLPECQTLHTDEARNIQLLMAIGRKLGRDPTLSERNKFERFTDALAERGYEFRSGLLKGKKASVLRREFRRAVGASVDELAKQQPSSQRLGFEVATKMALDDAVTYAPVPFYVLAGFTSSGIELAVSPSVFGWSDKDLRLRGGGRLSFNQAAPLKDGDATPALDTEAYFGSTLGTGMPFLKPLRLDLGLGLVTTATYLVKPSDWVSVRFAIEGSVALVAVEHIEVGLRPRLYLDLGNESSPIFIPTEPTGPTRHLNAVEVVLGAAWRF